MKKCWLLFVLLLAGCWDVKEPESMLYLHGIGVDFQDGEYIIYTQIIDFANIAKSEQPTNPQAIQADVGRSTGPTMAEAFYKLYTSMDQELFWGHFSYIIFSQEALEKGRANNVINTFIRFHNTRYSTWVYSTEDSVKDIMLTTPIINRAISSSKLSDPKNSFQQNSFIEALDFRRLIIELDEPSYEVKIPLIKLAKNWQSSKGKKDVTALNGVTVITPQTRKGILKNKQAQGLQWMSNASKRASFTTRKDQPLSIALTKSRVKVIPQVKGEDVTFRIDFQAEATLIGFQKSLTTADIKKVIKKNVEKEIRQTFEAGLAIEADVYRLSEHLYRKDVKAWKKLEKNGQIPLHSASITHINIMIPNVTSGRKIYKETIE